MCVVTENFINIDVRCTIKISGYLNQGPFLVNTRNISSQKKLYCTYMPKLQNSHIKPTLPKVS